MSRRRKLEEDLKEKIGQTGNPLSYRFVIDSLPVALLTVNSELKITDFNPMAEQITGFLSQDVIGKPCDGLLHSEGCGKDCPLKTVLRREKSVVRVETTIRNKAGETLPVRMHTAGLFDDRGKLIGAVEAFMDISYEKSLERQRNNMVSMFAHDMKSPIIAIHGFVHRLLAEKDNLTESQENYLRVIEREAENVESQINDFLEFSRLQSGRLRLNLGTTSLDKELLELFEKYRLRALEKGLELKYQSEEPLSMIEADTTLLNRAFSNLMDNAIKFSKEKGTIRMTARETDREIAVSIQDEGIGIDPEELPYIFDPFHRSERGEREGYGIGLAAAKTIINAHGGQIYVSSEPEKGSIFTLSFPKKRAKVVRPI
jgi:two-component system phosphate regulon sensor histidine kinase PhoR